MTEAPDMEEDEEGDLFFIEFEFGMDLEAYKPGGCRIWKPEVERLVGLQRGPSPSRPPVVSSRRPQMVKNTWSPGLT
jgi:hypothetical protein